MLATIAVAEALIKREYELVINDEFYIKLSKKEFDCLKKYMDELKKKEGVINKYV